MSDGLSEGVLWCRGNRRLKREVKPSKSFWKGLSFEKQKSQQTTFPQGEEKRFIISKKSLKKKLFFYGCQLDDILLSEMPLVKSLTWQKIEYTIE